MTATCRTWARMVSKTSLLALSILFPGSPSASSQGKRHVDERDGSWWERYGAPSFKQLFFFVGSCPEKAKRNADRHTHVCPRAEV